MRIVPLVDWPSDKTGTTTNSYRIDPLMATCIVLRRMATPDRWCGQQVLFGNKAPHFGEIFRESLQKFMHTSGDVVTPPIPGAFFRQHAQRYASADYEKKGCMDKVTRINIKCLSPVWFAARQQEMIIYLSRSFVKLVVHGLWERKVEKIMALTVTII